MAAVAEAASDVIETRDRIAALQHDLRPHLPGRLWGDLDIAIGELELAVREELTARLLVLARDVIRTQPGVFVMAPDDAPPMAAPPSDVSPRRQRQERALRLRTRRVLATITVAFGLGAAAGARLMRGRS